MTHDGVGAPVVTDGPFPESKEFLAGYWIVDVESEERAIEIAARASAAPGPGGRPIGARDRGAAGDGAAARRGAVTPAPSIEDLLRELAPQVLGAVVRRYGDFADCRGRGAGGAAGGRDAVAGRRACPTTRAAG